MGVPRPVDAGLGQEACPDKYRDHTPAGIRRYGRYTLLSCEDTGSKWNRTARQDKSKRPF